MSSICSSMYLIRSAWDKISCRNRSISFSYAIREDWDILLEVGSTDKSGDSDTRNSVVTVCAVRYDDDSVLCSSSE